MDAYMYVLYCGIKQNDFAARNVILCAYGTSIPRVALIDYNTAIVYRYTVDGKSMEESLALPVNPLQWFWKQAVGGDFPGWVSPEWEGSRKPM